MYFVLYSPLVYKHYTCFISYLHIEEQWTRGHLPFVTEKKSEQRAIAFRKYTSDLVKPGLFCFTYMQFKPDNDSG